METIKESPLISVIIVNYNTCELTRQCLTSLQSETAAITAEVIVVDNASSDDSREMIQKEFPEVELLAMQENLGFGKANNVGVRAAKGKHVILLNSDTIVKPQAFQKLLNFAEQKPSLGAVGPKLLNADGSLQKGCWRFPTFSRVLGETVGLWRLLGTPSNYLDKDYNHVRQVDFAIGACLLLPRKLYEEIGGFDEQFFMYSEETDLCMRMRKAGLKVYFYPESEIIHLGGGSQVTSGRRAKQFYNSQELFYRKYYGNIGVYLYRAIMAFRSILRIFIWSLLWIIKSKQRNNLVTKLSLNLWILGWCLGIIKHSGLK